VKVVLTGSGGFLGWHTRVRLRALTDHDVVAVTRDNWADLVGLAHGADAVIHVAGVNRATPAEVEHGNIALAEAVAEAVVKAGSSPRVVYANTIHAGNPNAYGAGKAAAADILEANAQATGGEFVDVRLPNLFGEHGQPAYNSFVATFVDAVVRGEQPQINDREVSLLHVQRAAQVLIDALWTSETTLSPAALPTSVGEVYALLSEFHELYATGDIPVLDTALRVDLFNTYRAALFPAHCPIALTAHADDRGRLVEIVRAHGGQGQTFVSTTKPGITRGEHFHLGKVERFAVLSGQARISLRRVFHDEVVSFDVSGDSPSVVDMPTMWAHNITNTGDTEVTTLFWTHSLFDAHNPDTFWEPVADVAKADA
jgi:UDP-2-acetamido-2,6-beta-L-arabino-hexul-4-ose reductase